MASTRDHVGGTCPASLSWRERAAYGAGDYGLNLFWQGAGFYFFFYYTDVLHLSNSLAGLLFAIGGLWDAASDLVVGYVSERTRSRFGRYRPYLLFGAPFLGLSFILAFAPPLVDDPVWTAVQTLAALMMFRSAYSSVSIPYAALSARLVDDGQERTRLAGVRMYFGFLGGISVVALGGWLREHNDDARAFLILAACCAVLACVALFACFRFTNERRPASDVGLPAPSVRIMVQSLSQNRPLIMLFFAIVFITVATSFITKTVLYIFEYGFGDGTAGDRSLFIFAVGPLFTIPFWSAVALQAGKRQAWQLASCFTCLGLLWLYVDRTGMVWMAWMGYGVTTLGLSAFGLLFWSMLPDTVEYGLSRTGIRNEAVIFGMASSFQKLALAGSALLLGLLLDAVGYRAGEVQAQSTLEGLRALSTIIPGLAIIAAAVAVAFYPLTRRYHEELVNSIRSAGRD